MPITPQKLHYYKPSSSAPRTQQIIESDICIYGATSGGIVAAVQCAMQKRKVVIAEFGSHIGGMTSSGLGSTDIGNEKVIGGLSRQFYKDVGAFYGKGDVQWAFEPHIALKVFKSWIDKYRIPVHFECRIAGVEKAGKKIHSVQMENGTVFKASIFIDASYDGDLMAKAGISYAVGREADIENNEVFNGNQCTSHDNFKRFVDPYRKPGNPGSGLLNGISKMEFGERGTGDSLIQAYNFRLCFSSNPENQVPFPKPPDYNRDDYELLLRYIHAGVFDIFDLTRPLPNKKADNNHTGAFNTDFVGENYKWPDGDYSLREKLFQSHLNYQMGLFYFLSNDNRLPEAVRNVTRKWGLAADEFAETGNWPPILYVRESRRMISDYVLSELDVLGKNSPEDPVCVGSYTMDSHNCKRVVKCDRVVNEGAVEISPVSPYRIPYGVICPRRDQCTNLLVSFCISSSHIAFGSVRIEPSFMVLSQSAAIAADLAISHNGVVQDISYSDLERRIRSEGQVVDLPGKLFVK